jgi:uridine phosphorylase
LKATSQAHLAKDWPCYHTELYTFLIGAQVIGIVGCAVGAPFAVLIAEELFASGCHFLISVTSAGQITPTAKLPYFVVIDRALRDEGTSYHYAPPSEYSEADPELIAVTTRALKANGVNAITGASWTTDAPFREIEEGIAAARSKGILAVEMEAAALYAFARARNRKVLCLAHVTNTMAVANKDFEKGEADGTVDALRVLEAIVSET